VTDDLAGWPVCSVCAGFGYIAAGSITQRSTKQKAQGFNRKPRTCWESGSASLRD
jgi:hypothetical protein